MPLTVLMPDGSDGNPYARLLQQSLRGAGVQTLASDDTQTRPDVVHLHWPEQFLSRRSFLKATALCLDVLRRRDRWRQGGSAVVWTVHNLRPHERLHPSLESWFYRRWIQGLDGVLALSPGGLVLAQERYPPLLRYPSAVTPHGHYRDLLDPTLDRSAVRHDLGYQPQEVVIGFVGQIRTYKQVPELIRMFRDLPPSYRLLVGGQVSGTALSTRVTEAAQGDARIRLELRFLPDRELQAFTSACDLICLPYREILNSGSAIYALSCQRPVLAPNAGALSELHAEVPDGLVLYDPPLTAKILASTASGMHARGSGWFDLSPLDWPVIGTNTAALYRSAVAHRKRAS